MATKTGTPGVGATLAEVVAEVERALGAQSGEIEGVSVADLEAVRRKIQSEGYEIEQVVALSPGQQIQGKWRGIFLGAPVVGEDGKLKQLPFAHIEVASGLVAKIVASHQIVADLQNYPAGEPVCIIMGNKVDMPGKGGRTVNRYLIAKKPVVRAALGAAIVMPALPPKS